MAYLFSDKNRLPGFEPSLMPTVDYKIMNICFEAYEHDSPI